jgi:glutathione S-transferase
MQLFWGMSFGAVEKRPAFEAYWQRVSDRDALRKATALDDAAAAELTSS